MRGLRLLKIKLEEEREAREMMLRHELQLKQLDIEMRRLELESSKSKDASPPDSKPVTVDKIKLPKFNDSDSQDVNMYLRAFEHIAEANGWPKSRWALHLAPQLSGKALAAYTALPSKEAMHYVCVKQAILDRYEVSAQFYRLKFRNSVRKNNENVRELVNNLFHHFIGWLKFAEVDINDPKAIVELMIMDQALRKLPQDLSTYLKDKGPASCQQLATLADAYVDNRGGSSYWRQNQFKPKWQQNRIPNAGNNQMRAPVTNTVRDPEKTVRFAPAPTGNNGTQLKCFNCNESGHIRSKCPKPRKDNSNGQRGKPNQDTSDPHCTVCPRKKLSKFLLNVAQKVTRI